MTQNARPRYGTPRWVKWFAGIVVVLIAIVVVVGIFAETEESDDATPVAPTATEAVTPTTVVTSVPTATPTPRPTLAPPSREEIANRCDKQYRHLVGNDEDGYRCGELTAEGYNRKRERERQAEEAIREREERAAVCERLRLAWHEWRLRGDSERARRLANERLIAAYPAEHLDFVRQDLKYGSHMWSAGIDALHAELGCPRP